MIWSRVVCLGLLVPIGGPAARFAQRHLQPAAFVGRKQLESEVRHGLGQGLALLAAELEMLGQRPPDDPSQVALRIDEFSAQAETAAECTADGASR